MYEAVARIMKDPDAVKRFAEDGLVATASTPAEFTAFVVSEIAEWSKLVQEMQLPIVTLGK
jgi:tripartite-type tricarboxylate transporter receptor subunit TctC